MGTEQLSLPFALFCNLFPSPITQPPCNTSKVTMNGRHPFGHSPFIGPAAVHIRCTTPSSDVVRVTGNCTAVGSIPLTSLQMDHMIRLPTVKHTTPSTVSTFSCLWSS